MVSNFWDTHRYLGAKASYVAKGLFIIFLWKKQLTNWQLFFLCRMPDDSPLSCAIVSHPHCFNSEVGIWQRYNTLACSSRIVLTTNFQAIN
jgi:hypothetical protein